MEQDKVIHIRCEAKEYIQLDDLIPLQGDLKSITKENFDKIKKSLINDGIPLGFHTWKDNNKIYIVDGHTRRLALLALRDEGYHIPALPCNPVVAKNKKEAAKVVLISNSRYAGITQESISDFMIDFELDLSDLDNLDIPDLNMDDFQLESDDKELNGDLDEVPELNKNNIHGVKEGDIWQLGDHRLMCGDSTNIECVEKLMNGQKADMVFTDPPYGMNLDADYSGMVNKEGVAGRTHKQVIGDDKDFDPAIIFGIFKYCSEILLFGADYYADKIPNRNEGSWLVWDKRLEEKYDKIIGSGFELLWSKKKRKRELIRFEYSSWGARMKDNQDGHKPHPTMKPVGLLELILAKASGEKVVDLFGGSGSTLIACEKTNRKCFMMELDPHYCSVIIERWQLATGKKAVKLD